MLLTNRRIQAVVFDLDDTLIDWSKKEIRGSDASYMHLQNVHAYLTRQGVSLPDYDLFYERFRETLINSWNEAKKSWVGVQFAQVIQDTLAAVAVDTAVINMDDLLRAYDWKPIPGIVPYDDALPLLDQLKNEGYLIGLITNSMQPMWMRDIELEAYGILPYLDARVTSGDTGYMKPHPAIYQRLLNLLDVPAETAVFVGDRPTNDIIGANQVGMVSVWIDPPHLDLPLNGVVPDYRITQLRELLPILTRLQQPSVTP